MKGDKVYLTHIRECSECIEQYTEDGPEVFFSGRSFKPRAAWLSAILLGIVPILGTSQ